MRDSSPHPAIFTAADSLCETPTAPWAAAHGLCYTRDMAIKRLDHVSVVVDDLAGAIAFFTVLGMTIEGEMPARALGVDRVNGLESVQRHRYDADPRWARAA